MTNEAMHESLVAALNERKAIMEEKKVILADVRARLERCEMDIDRYRQKLSGEDRQLTLEAE